MLENAVRLCPELNAITTSEAIDVSKGRPRLEFNQYVQQLQDAAAIRDIALGLKPMVTKRSYAANYTEADSYEDSYTYAPLHELYYTDLSQIHEASVPIDFQAHQASQSQSGRPFIERLVWNQLPPEARAILQQHGTKGSADEPSDAERRPEPGAKLYGVDRKRFGRDQAPEYRTPISSAGRRRIQLHEQTNDEEYDPDLPDDENPEQVSSSDDIPPTEDNQPLLAHLTERKRLPPRTHQPFVK
jgi:hypothetical protein